jgi:CRP-like cAMP-binding protein
MDQSATLLRCFLRYAHAFAVQSYYTALANAQGLLEERLARLLLTHEFLALILGSRRAGVTTALNHFDTKGVIATARGVVTVIDREGLEGCAKGLYGVPEAEFDRLFGR